MLWYLLWPHSESQEVCDAEIRPLAKYGIWWNMAWGQKWARGSSLWIQAESSYIQRGLSATIAWGSGEGEGSKGCMLWQDNALCHKANSVQSYVKAEMPRFFECGQVRANSPDLNPLVYSVCSILKEDMVDNKVIRNFGHLVWATEEKWDGLPQKLIRDTVDSWFVRVCKVEKANGSYID